MRNMRDIRNLISKFGTLNNKFCCLFVLRALQQYYYSNYSPTLEVQSWAHRWNSRSWRWQCEGGQVVTVRASAARWQYNPITGGRKSPHAVVILSGSPLAGSITARLTICLGPFVFTVTITSPPPTLHYHPHRLLLYQLFPSPRLSFGAYLFTSLVFTLC